MVASGSSYHAAMIGKYITEKLLRLPVEVSRASEFGEHEPIIDKKTFTVVISRSGESEDTIATMKEAARMGSPTVALCNVMDGPLSKYANAVVSIHAGKELGVSSTKTFTAQILGLVLLALYIGQERGLISERDMEGHLKSLMLLPDLMTILLVRDKEILKWSARYGGMEEFFVFGRGLGLPVAMEGALKLKEVSCVHAEGFPAGDIQHGPMALIDKNTAVIVLAPDGSPHQKLIRNLEMVKSRKGVVMAVAMEGDDEIRKRADIVFYLPPAEELLRPFLMSIPLQLLAYHMGVRRGLDVDQQARLIKSATVE
jgi:glutamine---fructose-6-phosphate transaminase (isomerizing)